MADVRALLRQQREARRIEHPHAAYSDAGKLLCTVCHEHIKTESLWDGHLRSVGHRQRLQLKTSGAPKQNGLTAEGNKQNDSRNGAGGGGAQSLKRKLDEDVEMGDADEQQAAQEDNIRKKRSKPDMTLGDLSPPSKKENNSIHNHKPITPPLTRRQSGTPTLGVEMQIPSRPATPGAMPQSAGSSAGGSASTVTTPKTAGPFARSPLIPHDSSSLASSASATASASPIPPTKQQQQQQHSTTAIPSISAPPPQSQTIPAATAAEVDEDEWAAFEADLLGPSSSKPAAANPKSIIESNVVVSAPEMSTEELKAKSEEEERAKRRAAVDIQIEDEREEATRALETEFEVMEELEARARKLRERREALRLRGGGAGDATGAAVPKETGGGVGGSGSSSGAGVGKVAVSVAAVLGKENAPGQVEDDDDDDEDEDEDETDDWVGFRFRS